MAGERVILFDDDPEYAESLKLLLEAEGYDVVCVFEGPSVILANHAALSTLEEVDLIVSDLMMPWMGGDRFFRYLRDRAVGTPFLLVSSALEPGPFMDLVRGQGMGAASKKDPDSILAEAKRLLAEE